jgi:hypothetical protein
MYPRAPSLRVRSAYRPHRGRSGAARRSPLISSRPDPRSNESSVITRSTLECLADRSAASGYSASRDRQGRLGLDQRADAEAHDRVGGPRPALASETRQQDSCATHHGWPGSRSPCPAIFAHWTPRVERAHARHSARTSSSSASLTDRGAPDGEWMVRSPPRAEADRTIRQILAGRSKNRVLVPPVGPVCRAHRRPEAERTGQRLEARRWRAS